MAYEIPFSHTYSHHNFASDDICIVIFQVGHLTCFQTFWSILTITSAADQIWTFQAQIYDLLVISHLMLYRLCIVTL
jgi:hypothetical protein